MSISSFVSLLFNNNWFAIILSLLSDLIMMTFHLLQSFLHIPEASIISREILRFLIIVTFFPQYFKAPKFSSINKDWKWPNTKQNFAFYDEILLLNSVSLLFSAVIFKDLLIVKWMQVFNKMILRVSWPWIYRRCNRKKQCKPIS